MGLFSKKKDESKEDCCCGSSCSCGSENIKEVEESKDTEVSVKILGSGCSKCNQLEANTVEALKSLGMDTNIDHITDFAKIAQYGVLSTPALVIDGKVAAYGKVLKTNEVAAILKKIRG